MVILKEEINNAMYCSSKETLKKIEEHFPGGLRIIFTARDNEYSCGKRQSFYSAIL